MVWKRKSEIEQATNKQPQKHKIQKEVETLRGELYIPVDLSKEINLKTRKGRKNKIKYKLQTENDITTAKKE